MKLLRFAAGSNVKEVAKGMGLDGRIGNKYMPAQGMAGLAFKDTRPW